MQRAAVARIIAQGADQAGNKMNRTISFLNANPMLFDIVHGNPFVKHAKRFFPFLFPGLFPLSARACSCAPMGFQERYDSASVITLVNMNGNARGSGREVIRSWKTGLPKRIAAPGSENSAWRGYGVGNGGIYLLYLCRNKEGEFSTSQCSGNPHESGRDFRERIDWLEKSGVAPGRD
ncbi:MAG: hypothetical protein LBE06_03750 [Azoarcus sp.]|nr:hypothetical protein [Azoarcus sp.]